ncbi:NAD(P)H nitroreductase [Mycobacterium sp. IS-1742]|uniref:Acg family FMN-binding oxidoreductase n=1 Tax=Mycobacterium sp. IS-1742 TaxID=1772285 RepID=UPI000740132A|nr:hypothetical protein [Mycobacterium sp. IS-1742]KUI30354.1 NAD(P)H nitroreductase [Mycobacterium sp. IS-1742]
MTHGSADTDTIVAAIRRACRAPSLHNSQPWRWIVDDASVDLFADHRRVVRSTDRSGREALISCGAALDHFRIAMAASGWRTEADRFPDPGERDHLASITFTPAPNVTAADRELAAAILRRRTDRLPFRAPERWETFEIALRRSIESGPVALVVLSDRSRPILAEASRLTESHRRHDAYYRDELRWWTEPHRPYRGVPPSALVSEEEQGRVDIGRTFPVTWHGDRCPEVRADEAKILVLSTPGDGRADALRCGEALSTVLLVCTVAGLATCPLTHVTELPQSRAAIAGLIGDRGVPQALIRAGRAPDVEETRAPTPRLPSSDVIQIRRSNQWEE